jgi:hypothetical protein
MTREQENGKLIWLVMTLVGLMLWPIVGGIIALAIMFVGSLFVSD